MQNARAWKASEGEKNMSLEETIYKILGWKVLASAKIGGKDVVVVRKKNRVELVYDHIIHSQIFDESIFTHQYWDYLLPLPAMFRRPRVLIMGLGGGTMPYQMKKIFGKKVLIEVVEKSPEMVKLSKTFLPKKLDAKITISEGISYVRKKRSEYDIIISDIYVGGRIPEELYLKKSAKYVHGALSKDGIFAVNYALTMNSAIRKKELLSMLGKYFKVYEIDYPGGRGNEIIICSKKYLCDEIISEVSNYFSNIPESRFLVKAYSGMKEVRHSHPRHTV